MMAFDIILLHCEYIHGRCPGASWENLVTSFEVADIYFNWPGNMFILNIFGGCCRCELKKLCCLKCMFNTLILYFNQRFGFVQYSYFTLKKCFQPLERCCLLALLHRREGSFYLVVFLFPFGSRWVKSRTKFTMKYEAQRQQGGQL